MPSYSQNGNQSNDTLPNNNIKDYIDQKCFNVQLEMRLAHLENMQRITNVQLCNYIPHWQQVAFGQNSWMHTPYMHQQAQPAAQHLSHSVNPAFFVPRTFPPVVTKTCLRPPPPPYFRPNIQNVCGETPTNIRCQSQIPNFQSNITPGPIPQEHSGNHYVRTSISSETPVIQAQSANWQREQKNSKNK